MLAFAKDSITITRTVEDETIDGYDPNPPTPAQVATGVRATIGAPSAQANLVGGDRIVTNAQMVCDLCDIQAADTVTDQNGVVWTVLTAVPQIGFAMDHIAVALRLVEGAASI